MWWAELAGDAGFRPVVLVSRQDKLARRTSVTIAEVTRRVRGTPSEVPLDLADGVPVACVVNCDAIHTILIDQLRARITVLASDAVEEINSALRFSLGLDL